MFDFLSDRIIKHCKVPKIVFFNLQKKKKVHRNHRPCKYCADLFMQSLPKGVFRPLAPIQTETELTQNVTQSAQLSSNTQDRTSVPY